MPVTRTRGLSPAFPEFAEETQRCSLVAARLDKDFDHISIGVHGPPKPGAPAFDPDHDFINMPCVGRSRVVTSDLGGDLMAKPDHPIPDRLLRNADAAFGPEVVNVAQAQVNPMLDPHGVANDVSRTSEAIDPGQIFDVQHHRQRSAPTT